MICNTKFVSQKGFSAFLIIFIVGLLSLSGFALYYFLVLNKNPEKELFTQSLIPKSSVVAPSASIATNLKDATLDEIKQFFNSYTWRDSTSSAEITSYGTLEGQGIEGLSILNSIDDYRNQASEDRLLMSQGWKTDVEQEADGVTGSVWGYYQDKGSQRRILNIRREMSRADAERMFQAREKLEEFKCPCTYQMEVFLSEWFEHKL